MGLFQRIENDPFHKRSGVRSVKEQRLLALRLRNYKIGEEVAIHYERGYHIDQVGCNLALREGNGCFLAFYFRVKFKKIVRSCERRGRRTTCYLIYLTQRMSM